MEICERNPRATGLQNHDGSGGPTSTAPQHVSQNAVQASEGEASDSQDKLLTKDDAHTTAISRLRMLQSQLERSEVPPLTELKKTIAFAISATSKDEEDKSSSEEGNLQLVQDDQVRAWLSSTFTNTDTTRKMLTFKTVVTAVMAGRQFEIHRESPAVNRGLQYPTGVSQLFEEEIDKWDFNIFKAESLTGNQPLRYVGYELFTKHDLFKKHKISPSCLDAFLTMVESGYGNHTNPYHNSTHGADVMQTVHKFIHTTGMKSWITDLEELALLLAAGIHDLDHPGTTNTFNVLSYSSFALYYNDKSVLENHHLYRAFTLLKRDDLNILKNLQPEEFRLVRSLVIDTVLATDMSFHFDHLKKMKTFLSTSPTPDYMDKKDRSNVFCLLVHMADISHPAKAWSLHSKWTERLMEEFFRQGDQEKELGRDCSPLCDRNNTSIPDSQIGFIDYIVSPSLEVCGGVLELLLSQPCEDGEEREAAVNAREWWEGNIQENKQMWREHGKRGNPSETDGDETHSSETSIRTKPTAISSDHDTSSCTV